MKSEQHFQFIDSLRGLAALNVVLFHLLLMPTPHLELSEWFKIQVMKGGSGVNLFFIISAFTLAMSWNNRSSESHRLISFYIRRFFRVAPLFYILMILSYFRDSLLFSSPPPIKLVLSTFTFTFGLLPKYYETFVWAGWTLGVEMLFYLVFPLFGSISKNILTTFFLFIASLLLSLYVSTVLFVDLGNYAHLNILSQLPYFLFGVFLYSLYERGYLISFPQKFNIFLGLFFAATYLYFLHGPVLSQLNVLWTCIIYGSLFVFGFKSSLLKKSYALRQLGKVSYSVYLFHPLVIFLFFTKYPTIYSRLPKDLAYLCSLGLVLTVLFPLAYASWKWIETPGQNMGKRIITKIQ